MDKRPESEVIIIDTDEGQQKVRVALAILANNSRAEIALLVADHLRQGVVVEEVPKIEPQVLVIPKMINAYMAEEKKRKPAKKGRNKWYRSMK
jgi:hypothetical protein